MNDLTLKLLRTRVRLPPGPPFGEIMAFVFTFLLIAVLESASADDVKKQKPVLPNAPEEPDVCVGCDDKKEKNEQPHPPVVIEIMIDPETGKIQYIVKNIVID